MISSMVSSYLVLVAVAIFTSPYYEHRNVHCPTHLSNDKRTRWVCQGHSTRSQGGQAQSSLWCRTFVPGGFDGFGIVVGAIQAL